MAKDQKPAAEPATEPEIVLTAAPVVVSKLMVLPKSFLHYAGVLHLRATGPIVVDSGYAATAREIGLLADDEEIITPE